MVVAVTSRGVRILALMSLFMLFACPGTARPPTPQRDQGGDRYVPSSDFKGWQRRDGQGPDVGPPDLGVPDVRPGSCSPGGTSKTCDPIAQSGCAAGACYIISQKGYACVCPAGTTAEGGACNATAECAPGLGCAGTSPPGRCRRFCSASSNTCGAGATCTPIDQFLAMGLCVPK